MRGFGEDASGVILVPKRSLFGRLAHLTSRARAVATARVLEMDAMSQHQIEDRAGLAVMMKRRLRGIEFDHLLGVTIFELDSQFRHMASVERQLLSAAT